jgi:NADH-quinone oxidoreductase subunit E
MLSDAERHEIEERMQRYELKRAVCVDALKIVQEHRGWVPDEAIRDIAALLEMTVDELDGVATFYSMIFRKPVGRHVIRVCDSAPCWIMGYEQLLEALKSHLGIVFGETTEDERFTLLPVSCLGVCDHAPVMMIDEDLHMDLTPDQVEGILAQYE